MIAGDPLNIQSILPDLVGNGSSCVSPFPKIYINGVNSIVLPHPTTKDLSLFTTSKFIPTTSYPRM